MTPDNEKRRRLYDNLKARGGLPVDYDTFSADMADSGKRSALYDKLSKMGGGLPDFDTFSNDIAGDLQTPAQPPAAPVPGKPQAPTANTPSPSALAGGSSASSPVLSGPPSPDLLGIKPMGSEVRETIPQQRIQVAQEVAADTGPDGLVQRNVQETKKRLSEDAVAIEELKARANAPVFSTKPPEQGQEGVLQVDPRWAAVMKDYIAAGGSQYSEQEIADRRAAGTWTLRDDARERMNAAYHQLSLIDDREQKLANAATILNERGVPAMAQKIHEMELDLTGFEQKAKDGSLPPDEYAKYQSLYKRYEATRNKYNQQIEPIIKEQEELAAARDYISSVVGDAIRSTAKDPLELERVGKQLMSNRSYDGSIRQDVVDPIQQEFRRYGGNAIATGARMLNAIGNLPNRAMGKEDYYSPFAEIADITAQGLERLEAEAPEQTKGALLNEDWSLAEGALPKFTRAATFLGLLGYSGSVAGVPGVASSSILGASEDYYQGALDQGLTPKQAEAIALLLSSTEAGIELANPGPFLNGGVRKQMAKKAVELLASGKTKPNVAREVFGYAAEQALGEGGEEVATEFAQDMVTRGFNLVEGSKLQTGLEMKSLAESFIMGAALGGLMGGGARASQRPLFKESIAWAVENPQEFTEYVNTKVPEAQRKDVLEKFDQQQRIYRGLPPTLPPEAKQDIAAAVSEKERLKKEQSETTIDDTVAAAMGNMFDERIAEQDRIIAEAMGVDLVDLAKKQEADRLREQYDKAKLKSEITGLPMPEGMTKPKEVGVTPQPSEITEITKTPVAVSQETVSKAPAGQTSVAESLTQPTTENMVESVTNAPQIEVVSAPIRLSKGLAGKFDAEGVRVNAHKGVNGVFATTDPEAAKGYAGDLPVSEVDIPEGTTIETIEVGGSMEDLREREIEAINASSADVVKLVTLDSGKRAKQEQYVLKRPDLVDAIMAPLSSKQKTDEAIRGEGRVQSTEGEAPKGQRADEAASKETPPPPAPPAGGLTGEAQDAPERVVKMRQTAKKIKEAFPEVFKALDLDEGTINYEALPNETSIEAARALIEWAGEAGPALELIKDGSRIPGAIKSKIYLALSGKYLEEKRYDDLVDLQDTFLPQITDAAQMIQAMHDTAGLLFPKEFWVRKASREVLKRRENNKKREGEKIRKAAKDIEKVNAEAVDQTLVNVGVAKKIISVSTAKKGGDGTVPPKAPSRGNKTQGASVAPKRREGFIKRETYEKWVSEMGSTMYSAIIPPQLIGIAAYHIQEGAITFAEVAEKVVRKLGRKALPYLKGAYKEAAKEFDWEGVEPSTDAEIDQYIAQANTGEVVAALEKAIEKKDKKAQQAAISKLQSVSKDMDTWGLYEKEAVSRLKRLTEQQISEDILDRPVLADFTAGLVRNMGAQIREQAKEKGVEKKRPEGPENYPMLDDISIIADAFKNIEKYRQVWESVQNSFKSRLRAAEARLEKAETPEAKKEAKDAIEAETEKLQQLDAYFGEILSKPFSEKGLGDAVKKGLKDLNVRIEDIIKQHYTVYDGTKRTLQEKLVEQAGLSGEDAKMLSDEVGRVFDSIAGKKRQAIIDRLISPKERKKAVRKDPIEKLTSMMNLGAFSVDEFIELYAESQGWPKLTKEVIQDIENLADRYQRAKDGRPKAEATEDMYAYLANIPGISKWEIGQALWYASVLSGPQTQEVNFFANMIQTMSEVSIGVQRALADGDPKSAVDIIKSALYGFTRGWYEAGSVMRTGRSPIRGKIEIPTTLERMTFGKVGVGGVDVNPFNKAKYVRRLMVSADVLFFEALKEVRAQQLAVKMANSSFPSEDVRNKALDILNRSDTAVESAEAQADSEYKDEIDAINANPTLTAKERAKAIKKAERDRRRRVFELVERERPQDIKADSARFAARATYNYTPEGLLGYVARGINFFLRDVPVARALIPFVNIIANVANESLNYTPLGFARAASGGSVTDAIQSKIRAKDPKDPLTPSQLEEYKADQTAKAINGLVAFTALLLMTQPGDDDEEPLIEVTANGTGNWTTNQPIDQATGRQSYSFKIRGTDKWISYRETPYFLLMALVGHYRDAIKYRKEKIDDTWMTRWAVAAGRTSGTLTDMTPISGLNNLIDAISDDSGEKTADKVTKIVGNIVRGGVVPAIYTQSARTVEAMFDIPQKDIRGTIAGYLYQDIPVLRDNLNDRINFLGDPIVPEGGMFVRFLNDAQTDQIATLINRGWIPSVPQSKGLKAYDPSIGKERLFTNDEQYLFYKTRGGLLKQYLLDNMDGLMEIPKADLDDWMSKVETAATREAKASILLKSDSGKWVFPEPMYKEPGNNK